MTIALFFLAGLAWWSLLEYLLHRHVFHRFPDTLGKRHLEHHAQLSVRRLAIASPSSSISGAAIHAALFVPLLGVARGGAALAGVLVGYVAYEAIHYGTHYTRPKSRFMKELRRHHMLHHHADRDAYFGVSSTLWDRVFGTLPRKAAAR